MSTISSPSSTPAPLPRPTATRKLFLVRLWRGETHTVFVHEDGFEWQGERHRSLSTIAKAITGTGWNGWTFFGVTKRPTRNKNAAGPRTRGPALVANTPLGKAAHA